MPKLRFTYSGSFSIAGNILNAITSVNPNYDSLGHKLFVGVPYSQFAVVDNKIVTYYKTGKHSLIAFRTMAGVGFPMKNSPTSLPYDYSFFAGGSNDNRGWAARSLGPGAYQGLLDPNLIATQIGEKDGFSPQNRNSIQKQSKFMAPSTGIISQNSCIRCGSTLESVSLSDIAS